MMKTMSNPSILNLRESIRVARRPMQSAARPDGRKAADVRDV